MKNFILIVWLLMAFMFQVKGQGFGIGVASPQNTLDVEGEAAIGSSYSGSNSAPTDGLIVEGQVGIGTNAPSNNVMLHVKDGHFKHQQTSAPSLNVNEDDGHNVSISGTDARGTITLGNSGNGNNNGDITITFNQAYNSTPIIIITQMNQMNKQYKFDITASSTDFRFEWKKNSGNDIEFNYWVIE